MALKSWPSCACRGGEPSRKPRTPPSFGECPGSWCAQAGRPGLWRCRESRKNSKNWYQIMPLIRKPTDRPAPKKTGLDDLLKGLADPDPDQRWTAAREAAQVVGGAAALAMALPTGNDPRGRHGVFTALA